MTPYLPSRCLQASLVLALLGCSGNGSGGASTATPSATPPASAAPASAAPATATPTAEPKLAPDSKADPKPAPERAAEVDEPGDRIYAKARNVWIQSSPRQSDGWLGYLSLGGSVRLYEGDKAKAKTVGPGCDAWYRVEPMGYVCLDAGSTLDPNDPEYVALKKDRADVTSPYPYQYGESLGVPRYDHIPTAAEQRRLEWDLEEHEKKVDTLRAALGSGDMTGVDSAYVGLDVSPSGESTPDFFPVGPLVREGRARVQRTSTIAFVRAFDQGNRTWLVTADHALVPKDRVRPYKKVDFAGVKLDGDVELPIAFVRRKDCELYSKVGERFELTGEKVKRLSWMMLTTETAEFEKKTYYHVKPGANGGSSFGPDIWVREGSNIGVAAKSETKPFLKNEANVGKKTWVDISIYAGTLVAYEDDKPVFATLIAPGRGGAPLPGHDVLSTASTPTGTFRVDGKFKTATMVSSTDSNIVHDNVQWVQNFHGPHALHGAYWHDGWGELKSGGCVNLSPSDSQTLFDWTEPKIPKDWYGMRSDPVFGPPTRVVVRR
ncbi:MAG: L,D-transpeptidase [Polyangiaceae bacterium]